MKAPTLIWFVCVIAGLLLLAILSAPTAVDTRIRLEREGDAPFDAEVFYQALPAWIGAEVTPVAEPAFVRLEDSTITGTTYLFLTRSFTPGEDEADRLLAFMERGNTVFAAAHDLSGPLFARLPGADSTSDDPAVGWMFDELLRGQLHTSDTLRLLSPGVEGTYGFPIDVDVSELYDLDPETTELLGETQDGLGVTLARVRVGEGSLILCTTPLVFSNAALVGEGDAVAYVSAVLAALPRQPVLWDDYRKPFREQAQTPLRYVLGSPGLRGAYFLLLSLFVLYVLFRGRRWQRAIPVVTPPPNAQREFARTIGRLHLTHGDDSRLAARKVRVFLDALRTRLRMLDPDLSDGSARQAAKRAGVPEDEGLALFAHLRRVQAERRPVSQDLVDLDARLDRFFRHLDAPAPADEARQPAETL